MTSLTNPVNKQNIVDRFADYVAATANSGISWGTNAYPFAEWDKAAQFGGSTSGKSIEISGADIAANSSDEITAQNIYDTLIAETYRYTNIRNLRALLYVDGAGGNTGSRPTAGYVYDGTAVAYMNTNYRQSVSSGRSDVYAGNTITSTGMEAMYDSMRANYNSARATTYNYLQTNVCHASCHSSCHSSRGRR
jgi:hypothetical protein